MSIETINPHPQKETAGTCNAIKTMIYPDKVDLGGFSVQRVLPAKQNTMVGPWIFFDHMGPAKFKPGEGIDVRPHPHINLATVTYLFTGEMLHRDSLGNELLIHPGEINLMVAGKGIVHSERQRPEIKAENNVLDGLQLWLALPEEDEEIAPEFHHYDASDIPKVKLDSATVSVLIGAAYGVESPVKYFAKTLYIEVTLEAGQRLTLPDEVEERAIYIAEGQLNSGESVIEQYNMAVLNPGLTVTVEATRRSHFVVIGGEPFSHRYIWWNFVSSRQERIEQAKRDWQNGRFAKVPGDETEFIPLPNA